MHAKQNHIYNFNGTRLLYEGYKKQRYSIQSIFHALLKLFFFHNHNSQQHGTKNLIFTSKKKKKNWLDDNLKVYVIVLSNKDNNVINNTHGNVWRSTAYIFLNKF